jgi:molybdenum-dependent DNA-binding transcriptional regulator ModE
MIKGNAVKRLVKEYQMYHKEVLNLLTKYDEMKTENSDEYSLNKHKEFLDESIGARNMIKTKLRTMTDELINLINEIEDEETKNLEEYKNANDYLKSSSHLFESI